MDTLIHIQPPFDTIRVEHFPADAAGEFATVTFEGTRQKAVLFLYTRAEADDVIRAAIAARDLLPDDTGGGS